MTEDKIRNDPGATAPEELVLMRAENAELRNEINELRARFSALEVIADTDTLTPLPNRRCFLRELDRVMRHVSRYHTGAAVLYVDVDGLKQINDRFGHSHGDAALIHVATLLRSTLRSTDLVARIGGDEFGLLLDPIHEDALLRKIATLSKTVRSMPAALGNERFPVEISIGYTMILADDDIAAILRRADDSMYGEKNVHRSAR
jgi:diguanylate cyclase (GGDEF)-like protein